jgi:hypothetical protein
MKKKASVFFICLALVFGMTTGALAAGNLEAISAYLNRDIKIVYNGQAQFMTDTAGKVVYPISYNGTTYLPVRAVSGMLGVDVSWDGATSTVFLGKIPGGMDFINNIKPYEGQGHYSTADKKTAEIAGRTYDHYINLRVYNTSGYYNRLRYDLAEKYETMTFKAYNASDYSSSPYIIYFWGDNDVLLHSFEVKGLDLPKEYTIDLTGVQQLGIDANGSCYLFDMIIE